MSSRASAEGLGIFNVHPHRQPDSEAVSRPVDVRIAFLNIAVTDYDDRSCTATVSYKIVQSWRDPRLAGWPDGAEFPDDLWVPPLFCFGRNSEEDTARLEAGTWRARGSVGFVPGGRATGEVMLDNPITNEVVPCKYSADLRQFPLDSHDIILCVSTPPQGGSKLVVHDPSTGPALLGEEGVPRSRERTTQLLGDGQSGEWTTTRIAWGFGQHGSKATGIVYHDACVVLTRRRVPLFYLYKGVYPTAMCGLISLSALIIPSGELEARLSVLLSLFLTVFAIQWVVTDRLPKLPFLTRLDSVVYATSVFILLICLVSMLLCGLDRLGVENDAILLGEQCSFALFATTYVLYALSQHIGIRGHFRSNAAATDRAEDGWRHKHIQREKGYYYYNVDMWDGCLWSALVSSDGRLGPLQQLPSRTPCPKHAGFDGATELVPNPLGFLPPAPTHGPSPDSNG